MGESQLLFLVSCALAGAHHFLFLMTLPVNHVTFFQDDVVVSKGLNGSTRGFRGHLFLLDQRLIITHQQSKYKTFQYIDDIAVSGSKGVCVGAACLSGAALVGGCFDRLLGLLSTVCDIVTSAHTHKHTHAQAHTHSTHTHTHMHTQFRHMCAPLLPLCHSPHTLNYSNHFTLSHPVLPLPPPFPLPSCSFQSLSFWTPLGISHATCPSATTV